MPTDARAISRRGVLRAAGALGVLGAGGTGVVAGDDTVEVNVGYSRPSGRRAARDEAKSVEREFSFDALTIRTSRDGADRLRNRGDIRYVEENGEMHALAQELPWGIDRVDAEVAHDNGETGNGADIAIIDTGIDHDHPDLQANLGDGKAFISCGSRHSGRPCFGADCEYEWSDDHDHGTHCAGIADAVDNSEGVVGVSTEATLHAVKVLDCHGSGTYSNVAAGIEYVADQGWDVGSLSLGGSKSDVVEDAVEYAYGKGVLLVAAAGNDGPCSDCVGYPAAEPEVIAVSATSEDDSLASFSSTGPEVELAAPGEDIYSTVIDGYATYSGTSMACPHVSGAGGQLMANEYTNTEARDHLKSTAEDIGLSSNEQGSGLLDVAAALGLDSSDDLSGDDTSVAVSTDAASDVTDSSATLNGTLDDLGGADSADVHFEWRQTGADTWNATSTQTLSSTGSFSEEVSGLDSDTEYEYRAVAEASDGDSDTGSTVTFTTDGGDSSGDSAPTIDTFQVSTRTTGPWNRADVTWEVSDADGDLDTVTSELLDSGGKVLDSATSDVSGSSASGEHNLRTRDSDDDSVRLTVTDEAGNTSSDSKSI